MEEVNLKNVRYYSSPRGDLMRLIPARVKKVLDVGCGEGMLGEALKKQRPDVEVIGIEIYEKSANMAKTRLTDVFVGNIENLEFPFSSGNFDCIIYEDVLEHLVDPWRQLKIAHKWLSDEGGLIASISNVAYYEAIVNLIRKRWDYQTRGLWDLSHLRFFTLKSIHQMFNGADYKIQHIERHYRWIEKGCLYDRWAKIWSVVPLVGDFFVFKYNLVATKK